VKREELVYDGGTPVQMTIEQAERFEGAKTICYNCGLEQELVIYWGTNPPELVSKPTDKSVNVEGL
jgi:hypothetical protein